MNSFVCKKLIYILLLIPCLACLWLGLRQITVTNTGNMEYKIIIDPGHGGIDTGTHYRDIYEKNINLAIAQKLALELSRANIIPILTRKDDSLYQKSRKRDLRHRAELCKKYSPDFFISIHVNNFPSTQPAGSQVFYKTKSEVSREMSTYLTDELKKMRPENNREPLPGNYYVLNQATCPALLIETGFISNPGDRRLLTDNNYQKQLALSLKEGIVSYFRDTLSPDYRSDKPVSGYPETVSEQPSFSLYCPDPESQNLALVRRKYSYPSGSYLTRDFSQLKIQEFLALTALEQLFREIESINSDWNIIPVGVSFNQNRLVVNLIDKQQKLPVTANLGAGSEQLLLAAITKTLFSIPGIEEIEILLAGEKGQSLGGHIYPGLITK